MGSQDTITRLEKENMRLVAQLNALLSKESSADADSAALKVSEKLVAKLQKEVKSLKTKNASLSKKASSLEASLKAVDTAVDEALDD
jgi:hypothetical protein